MSEQRAGYRISMPYSDYREEIMTGFPQATYHPGQVDLTDTAQEQIRQIVREEIRDAVYEYSVLNGKISHMPYPQTKALDHLMEAVQGEPDPDIEMAAVLATLSEDEWNALVERVKEMKRE